jgi:hypothetical protein
LKRNLVRWLALPSVVLAMAACGSDGSDGANSTTTPEVEAPPEGDDNVYPVGSATGETGVLYNAIAVDNERMYACTAAHGMQILAKSANGALTTELQSGAFPEGRGCRDIVRAPDGTLFATGQSTEKAGSWIVALRPGAKVDIIGSVDVAASVESLVATDTHVFAVLGEAGIRVFGRNDGALAEMASLSGFDQALGAAMWGDKLVVANGQSGLAVVDVSNPTAPVITDNINIKNQTARRLAIVDDIAYVAAVNQVSLLDLSASNPAAERTSWFTYGQALDIAVTDTGLAYIANLEDVAVVDVSDRSEPVLIGSEMVPTADGTNARVVGIDTWNSVAYVAEWSQLWALSVAPDRAAPDIRLAKPSLDFGLVTDDPDSTSDWKGKGLIVENLGNKALEIAGLSTDDARFVASVSTVDDQDGSYDEETGLLTLKPQGRAVLQVVFTPSDNEPAKASLMLPTNDPDEGNVAVPLSANSQDGVQVGGPFDPNGELVFDDAKTGNAVTIKGTYPGQVVLLAYFATW